MNTPTQQDLELLAKELSTTVPLVSLERSTLGGEANASIHVLIALEPKETWRNGIMHNSQYARIAIHYYNVEMYTNTSNIKKMRSFQPKDINQVLTKIKKWITLAKEGI